MIPKHRPGPLGKSCLTCKQRHKKCDQRQPVCKRCEDGQFECLGYNHNGKMKMSSARSAAIHATEVVNNTCSTCSMSSGLALSSGNMGDLFLGERFERTPVMSSPPESCIDSDRNDEDVDFAGVSEHCGKFELVTPQKRRMEEYFYHFATRSTLKATDSPMSILRKIINLQTQLSPSPSDPLKKFIDSHWSLEYILANSDKVTDHCYFKPANLKGRRFREDVVIRLRTSHFARWIALVSMCVVEDFRTSNAPENPLHSLWVGHIECAVKRELTRDLAPREMQQHHSDLVHISLLKTIVVRGSNLYKVLQDITPAFLHVVYSDAKLWPSGSDFACVPLSNILNSEAHELALFALMDCTCAIAFGLPQHVEYDTTIYSPPSSLLSVQWAYGTPVEFHAVLADINSCRDQSPTAHDWREIEQWLLTWQSRPKVLAFAESWMEVAWYAVQESWRLALLTYLHMAVCGATSDDPKIQFYIKQILQVIGTVGICARNEVHRKVVREELLAPKGTKLWLMRSSYFVPVLDHLWHGAAAGQPRALGHKINELLAEGEAEFVIRTLRTAIGRNKAAVLLYLQFLEVRQGTYVPCRMVFSVAGNVIVGSVSLASLDTIGTTIHDQSAEEIIIAVTELTHHPGVVGCPAANWTGTQFPRTALLLDRFTLHCDIIHCSNNAILSTNCVGVRGGILKYVVERDIASVRDFIRSLKRSGIKADSPTNVGFLYHTFALCVAGRDFIPLTGEIRVSAVGIASSDGIILVLKREP
ncbi:putative transcriptional regulatory protein C965,10 [Schizosaccharomyces pombe 972h-] [Rhizoctonia solani]|uniref:Putative transcriptional regulatory protein C965,10 [Schizosaccharomyces pombe 972h-] n=1 Tax=Rhizoctonia solani TaxID=456999 RepID=A0A0K6G3T3_9AGAM|nr:putative transcriptional regulatory protein C965,10 [Schizosaccharomyces pombe 972h-] [Rhizoctonia solani]